MKKMKYGNRKTVYEGITFDSQKEARRYRELRLLQKVGQIAELKLQVPYILIPAGNGERAVKYIADFTYIENGKQIVEDVKGYKTRDYILKRKMFKYLYCGEYVVFREV